MYEMQKKFPNNHFGVLYGLSEIASISISDYGEDLKVMREPTRGGLATTLCEFVQNSD